MFPPSGIPVAIFTGINSGWNPERKEHEQNNRFLLSQEEDFEGWQENFLYSL
jgi:hypothetical protein